MDNGRLYLYRHFMISKGTGDVRNEIAPVKWFTCIQDVRNFSSKQDSAERWSCSSYLRHARSEEAYMNGCSSHGARRRPATFFAIGWNGSVPTCRPRGQLKPPDCKQSRMSLAGPSLQYRRRIANRTKVVDGVAGGWVSRGRIV